jgi:glyoxylase-like metal-dependent hydrolase (beta-lactamase superfamily II)
MDKIPVSDNDIVSLEHVAEGLSGLRIAFVNLFAVSRGRGDWTLIDAGTPLSADRIRRWTTSQFGDVPPKSIVLTHGHFDHVGALEDLAEQWNVHVYAHPLELPYVTGQKQYPPPDPAVGGGLMALMSPLYPRGPVDVRDRAQQLPTDHSVPDLPGWRWIHTPGHTEGHVSFFRDSDRTLIVGDAFCTTKAESLAAVATQRPELHGPPAYYTSDWDKARASVEQLSLLRPSCVAPGHGQPMAGTHVADALSELARNFDRVARPHHGKYAA